MNKCEHPIFRSPCSGGSKNLGSDPGESDQTQLNNIGIHNPWGRSWTYYMIPRAVMNFPVVHQCWRV